MLSKNKCKFINSLRIKKFRDKHGLFVAEGDKLVNEILNSELKISTLISTSEWAEKNKEALNYKIKDAEFIKTTLTEIKKISELISVPEVLTIVRIPVNQFNYESIEESLILVLDDIQNPGNLGTIIRIADWFGTETIICSPYCADLYNSKVVQASMGAICRVRVYYMNLPDFLGRVKEKNAYRVYGTFLEGENIYKANLSDKGIIIMGNEGNGIANEIIPFISDKLFIPGYPPGKKTSESLNVAIATSIVCSEFRRRMI